MEAPPTRIPWWAAPAAIVLLLVLLALLFGSPGGVKPSGSSYDASPRGVRAAFLLLEGLKYDVGVSRRITEGRVRWVLWPTKPLREAAGLDSWVRQGNVLLVAEEDNEFASRLLAEGPSAGKPAWWPDQERPLAAVHKRGRGEIWIVQHPEIFLNESIRKDDNAVDVCRLADAFSERGRILFDEYHHGLRERPGAVELLLEPPALWVTLQGAVLLALALWHFLPRFGTVQPQAPARRRSKEEFLDAMAGLLERKRAHQEAYQINHDALARDLEQALGLPPGTPPEEIAVHAAARFTGRDTTRLARVLARTELVRADAPGLLHAVKEIEELRDEFLNVRHHP
jgi:hypothetical protein